MRLNSRFFFQRAIISHEARLIICSWITAIATWKSDSPMPNRWTFNRAFRLGLTSCLFSLAFTSTQATIDLNNDGLDDIWQTLYGCARINPERHRGRRRSGRYHLAKHRHRRPCRLVNEWDGATRAASVSAQSRRPWSMAGFGDFNGDGNTDIVWQNKVTGSRAHLVDEWDDDK